MRSPGMRRFEPSVSVLQTVFHEFISSTPIRCGRHVQRFFSDIRLVKLMEWPVLFLGGSPARVRLRLPASLWSRHIALCTGNESVRFMCELTTCVHARTHPHVTHALATRTHASRTHAARPACIGAESIRATPEPATPISVGWARRGGDRCGRSLRCTV